MHTIRARLAVGYAMALGATLFVFAGIIYIAQGSQAFAELDSRVRVESDLIAAILGESFRARERVVVADPLGRPVLTPDVASLLEGVPGYVIVVGPERALLHLSAEARSLPFGSARALIDVAEDSVAGGFGLVDLAAPVGQVRYFVRPISEAGPNVAAVVSAAPTSGFVVSPPRLLTAMLWTVPFILVVSLVIGYLLVGRTLKPVDLIVDEVEAISDGRSLHRRLAEPTSYDELARLTVTLNAMLSRLEKSFGTLRRFTADASHELKTPLTVLRSGIERSLTHPTTSPEVMETLEETLLEVNRMAELVDSLLTLARADEGRAPLHLDDLDLSEMLAELAETASILGEQASVNVTVEVPPEPIRMHADRGRLRQLLQNLLSNAIKYTSAGGEVWIGSALDDGNVVFTVRDSGMGIAPGDLEHIFDRFWRADPARSRTGSRPGAGLGLAICKWTAEAHGGSIEVQSKPGRGTTFTVSLPLGLDQDQPLP
ncbi:MAG: ATP-binding protein [Gemmatimonadales bacterium]|jgi:signal transduction histidine kinase